MHVIYLSFWEREEIALLKAQGRGVRAIARELERDPGTISRELRRNAATRGGKREYRASVAQWKAQTAARRPKPAKLASNPRLQEYVSTRLSGQLQRPDGTVAAGPPTTWKGLNKTHRADRRWATAWSPEQISRRLVNDCPSRCAQARAASPSASPPACPAAGRSSPWLAARPTPTVPAPGGSSPTRPSGCSTSRAEPRGGGP